MNFKLLCSICLSSILLLLAGCATGSSERDIELQDSLETVRIADSLLNLELSLDDSLDFELDTSSILRKK